MASKRPKVVWTVWAGRGNVDSGYRTLELHFKRCTPRDAAGKLADAVRAGDTERERHYTKMARALREATGSTVYYGHCEDYEPAEFTVRWQANKAKGSYHSDGPSDWYAPHVEHGDLSRHVANAIAKLAKLPCEPSPRDVISALKAKPCVYVSEAWEHARADIDADLVSPLDEQNAAAEESVA